MSTVSCRDIAAVAPEAIDCCSSCHADEDEYGMTGGWWLYTEDREVIVCCGVSVFLAALPDRGEALAGAALALSTGRSLPARGETP